MVESTLPGTLGGGSRHGRQILLGEDGSRSPAIMVRYSCGALKSRAQLRGITADAA